MAAHELRAQLAEDRRKLLEVRATRVRPHLDDKVLVSWNGLMIGSLAYAGRHLEEPRYTGAAERAASFVLSEMRENGRLFRSYRKGRASLGAYLDDYAFLANGLADLHEATGKREYLDESKALMDVLAEHYFDDAAGGFFFVADDHEELLTRSKDALDRATPSGNGMATRVLVALNRLTGEKHYSDRARATLETFSGLMARAPLGTQSLILSGALLLDTAAEARTASRHGVFPLDKEQR
jgi:uncharacterized protein YyaL (SSP411 family)